MGFDVLEDLHIENWEGKQWEHSEGKGNVVSDLTYICKW